jgi:hypothetical protein
MSFLAAFSFTACNSDNMKTATGNTGSSTIPINLKDMKYIGTVDGRHDMKGHQSCMTILVINTDKQSISINIPTRAEQYTLTSAELQGKSVQLNGNELKLGANDELPAIEDKPTRSDDVTIPAASISFFTVADAGMKNLK